MAKHKAHRALFEILAKQHGRDEGAPVGGVKATPVPRVPEPPRREAPGPAMVRPVPLRAPVVVAGAGLTYGHLVLIGLAAAALCLFFYLLGGWLRGEPGLPVTQKHPTMDEIRGGPVARDLIVPGVERPSPAGSGQQPGGAPAGTKAGPTPGRRKLVPPDKAGAEPGATERLGGTAVGPTPGGAERAGGAEKAGGAQKAPAPTGPRYRVRIATYDIGQPSAVDPLRGFLQQAGIETEDVPGRGVHVLYSLEQFTDKKKSDELGAKIRKQLEAFEKQARQRTSKDAYSEQIKE